MSQIAKDINKITGTIIGVSGRLILYALVILLAAEGVTRGYAFGHSIFYQQAVEEAPGTDKGITITGAESEREVIEQLKDLGLIDSVLTARFQMLFYEYEIQPGTYTLNTSMTSKEILQMLDEGLEEPEEGGDGQ